MGYWKRVATLRPGERRLLLSDTTGPKRSAYVKFSVETDFDIGGYLEGLERSAAVRALENAQKQVGKFLSRAIADAAPKPGYKGDKKGVPALNKSIRYRIKAYTSTKQGNLAYSKRDLTRTTKYKNGRVLLVVGGKWREGQHAHLVERGHKKVLWGRVTDEQVEPHPFQKTTVNRLRKRVLSLLSNSLAAERKKALRQAMSRGQKAELMAAEALAQSTTRQAGVRKPRIVRVATAANWKTIRDAVKSTDAAFRRDATGRIAGVYDNPESVVRTAVVYRVTTRENWRNIRKSVKRSALLRDAAGRVVGVRE